MRYIIISLLLLSATLFVGCKDNSASRNNVDFAKGNTDKIVLSLVTQDALRGPSYQGYRELAQKLEELSGGTMTVDINQLTKFGTLTDIFHSVVGGQFDIATLGYSDKSNIIPELSIVSEPYLVRDYEHLVKILESDYGKKMAAKFSEFGLRHSATWYAGKRQTTSNKPLNSLKDFEGLKIRIPPTETLIAFTKYIGAESITINFGELYDALKEGIAEAQENPLPTIEAAKIYEVHKYIAITDHIIGTAALFINQKKYDSFTDEQKAWFDEAVAYGGQVCNEIVYKQEADLLEKFQLEYNMTITYPNKDELRAALKPHLDNLETKFEQISIDDIISIK